MTDSTQITAPTGWLHIYTTWLKAHEKLILIGVGAFLLFHFYDRGISAWLAHDERASSQAGIQVKTDHDSNQKIQDELAQLLVTVGQQQVQIEKIAAQRAVQTTEQKKKDSQMTPSELAQRFQGLLKVGPADVTSVEPAGNLVFTPPAAQASIDALEDLQACKADKVDLQTELVAEQSVVTKQTDALTGVQKELADEKVSHAADVKTEKAKSKRSWIRGFKIGLIVGAVGTEAVRIWAGHP